MTDETPSPSDVPARRTFLTRAAAIVAGGVAALAPLAAGLAAFLDPLRRSAEDRGLVRVTRLSVLPPDGQPRKFTIRADRQDAWTTYQDTPVGAVYLRRTGDDVVALNVVCPHAGCFVNVADDGAHFRCPCHNSSFALDGSIADPASPAPRGMDELAVEVRDDEVWVRYQNFRTGRADKTPVA